MPVVPQYSDIQFGFDVRTTAPIDRRFLLSAEEMEAGKVKWNQDPKDPTKFTYIPLEDIMPEVYIVQCSDDKLLYIYDKNRTETDEYTHGKFKLLTKVLDVQDEKGVSLIDSEGIAHVYNGDHDEIQKIKDYIANTINPDLVRLDAEVKLKADQTALDSEANRAIAEEKDLDRRVSLLEDGPYITENWISAYDVGGVAKYQAFKKGTSLQAIVKQILNGDPREDGIIFYAAVDELPNYMKDITWSQALVTRSELAADGFEIDHQIMNNKILVLALPRAMVKQAATEVIGQPEVNPVELKYIYAPSMKEFKYDWSYIDIKRDAFNTEWGYRLYFPCHRDGTTITPSKSTGDISRCYTFYLHDPDDPDPSKLGN